MRIVVLDTEEQFNKTVALMVAAQLVQKPHSNIGMAGGSTTGGVHRELVSLYEAGVISFKDAHLFSIDIRYPLPLDHPGSIRALMARELYDHVDLPKDHAHTPDSSGDDPQQAVDDYIQLIRDLGGLDMQVLPIGENGHIGNCQPGTPFGGSAMVRELPPEYKSEEKALPFGGAHLFGGVEGIPLTSLTFGPKDVMHAREILLCAKGAHKAEVMGKVVNGPVTEDVPASIVQLHPHATIVLEKEAAKYL
ncbi:glucosamine-6-phosphate deaminase [Eubacteriales bacterium OttesenSCG-928-M02]|nr:glucosamine-6-phosphate deaminase [Eubacteriales bacterium OttesenSCG-928-M02]